MTQENKELMKVMAAMTVGGMLLISLFVYGVRPQVAGAKRVPQIKKAMMHKPVISTGIKFNQKVR